MNRTSPTLGRTKNCLLKPALAGIVTAGLVCSTVPAFAAPADAPGAPGASATWTKGDKDGVGTSISETSKVWYTLTNGTLSEVYYPRADTANTREVQFAVSDGTTAQRESDGTTQVTELADVQSLTYRQIATDNAGRWRLTKTYVTDPKRSSVAVNVTFESLDGGEYRLYALFDPSLSGTAGNDTGSTVNGTRDALVAEDLSDPTTPVATALVSSSGFSATSTGYVGTSDGWTALSTTGSIGDEYLTAGPGNIAQTAEIPVSAASTSFTLVLGFGGNIDEAQATANATLDDGYEAVSAAYAGEWHDYLASLKPTPSALTGDLATQYAVSLMTVRAHEDKTYPGAFIASLTIPWGQAKDATTRQEGYHAVWARDMYQQVTALLAAGDSEAARRAVDWLFTYQQESNGRFPQTSTVDGTPGQTNTQLDETAFPIILAGEVGRTDAAFYQAEIKPAADFLIASGPKTPQERWEETGGYSPSTLASQIAALTVAASIATSNGDIAGAAIYQATADEWQRSTEKWLYTTNGPVGDGQYYIRISESGNPNDGAIRNWANGAGEQPENAVLDTGFLEFTRLGVKAADDSFVAGSLAETDASIGQEVPGGEMWHRYTYDGYGEKADGSPWDGTGIGRLWPLLSGERGEYALANGEDAVPYLATMHSAANDGFMIPEQVWDSEDPTAYNHEIGKSVGSASPLAWAMAQYVRLAQGIENGAPVETPDAVAGRYASGATPGEAALTVDSPADQSTVSSRQVSVTGSTSAESIFVSVNGTKTQVPVTDGRFDATLTLPAVSNQIVVAAIDDDGSTAESTVTVYAFGEKVGSVTDPQGDDNGPGSYVYPTINAFNAGSMDLTGMDIYRDGDAVRFVTSTAGAINNPWGGNGMSTQRLNIYIHDGTDSGTTPLLPGTNTSASGTWSHAIVADGRYDTGQFGRGVYGPDLARVGEADLQVIPAGKIVTTVPAETLGDVNLANAGYQVSMYSDAEEGEGIGNVRPVYSRDCWDGINGCPAFVKEFRFGGGAGDWTDSNIARDTDVSDSNAIDMITGAVPQSSVMDWTRGPVIAPYVTLDSVSVPTIIDTKVTLTGKKVSGKVVLTAKAVNNGETPVTLTVETPFGPVQIGTVAPGATKSVSLNTRLSRVPGATITVLATAPDGTTRTYQVRYAGTGW